MMASPRRIDVHFHLIPPFYREAVYAAGRGPAIGKYPDWTPALALDVMDAHGIEVALTSLAQPGVGFGGAASAGAGAAVQRLRRRARRALAHALRRFWHGADVEHAGRARRDRPFARRAQVRRRLAVCELRRKFPRRSGVRSSARDAERARRGRVRPPRPASLEQGAGAALARLHDGVPVRHHARGGEPDFLRRDRALPARSFHLAARRRARALFRLAAFSVADDRSAPAAARARAGLRRLQAFLVRQRALAGGTDLRRARSRRAAGARRVRHRLPLRQSARHRRDGQDLRIRVPFAGAARANRPHQRPRAVSEILLTDPPYREPRP